MSSVHPAYGQPAVGAYNSYDRQQPGGNQVYYGAPPGLVPQQGYYAPPGAAPTPEYGASQNYAAPPGYGAPQQYAPPPGYEAPQLYTPPPGYGAPQQYVPPGGYSAPQQYGPPPGYGTPPQYAPMSVAVNPATSGYTPQGYDPVYAAAPPPGYGNGIPVAVLIPAQVFADPVKPQEQDPANHITTGRWSVELCSCCDSCIPNACMAWCCPCVSLAQIYARVGLSKYWTALLRFILMVVIGLVFRYGVQGQASAMTYRGGYDKNGNYVVQGSGADPMAIVGNVGYLIIQILFAASVLHARTHIRHRFKIPGNGCCDCLISCCCSCCAIAQMATHVKSYKRGDCSFGAPDVLPAFN